MDWVILTATVVIAIATAVYAGLTWRLSQDNRALLKAGTEPEVVAYWEIERTSGYLVYLVLENVGQGPACDVEYTVDADPQDFADHQVLKVPTRTKRKIASLIPQGGQGKRLMGSSVTLLGNGRPALRPFRVKISYSNIRGVAVEPREHTIDISEMRDIYENPPPEERIAKSVEKIERHLRR